MTHARAALGLGLCLTLAGGCTTTATPPVATTASSSAASSSAATAGTAGIGPAAVDLLNAQRRAAGLAPVTLDRRLSAAAERHAADMAGRRTMTHVSADGGTIVDRLSAQGYCYAMAAENVAFGIPDVQTVMAGWMNSSGHRRNMLDPRVRQIGIGASNGYWVLDLARPC